MNQNRTIILVLFALISCGGGGGGSSNNVPVISQTPTPPTAPPSLSYEELKQQYEGYYEYQNQWGLDMINASAAYESFFSSIFILGLFINLELILDTNPIGLKVKNLL